MKLTDWSLFWHPNIQTQRQTAVAYCTYGV